MRFAVAVLLLTACATFDNAFKTAHHDSLTTLAANDFSCPRDQIAAKETGDDVWNAQGCGHSQDYKLRNHACLVERDCSWEQQPTPPPPPAK
jgi:hypothetical protein